MAKRAAPDEQPYRPLLDMNLVSVASAPGPKVDVDSQTVNGKSETKVIEMSRSDATNRNDQAARNDSNKTMTAPQEFADKLDHEKRILFTRSETQGIDRLVTSLATRLNTQVKVSHVIRALVGLLLHAEGHLDKRAGEASPLTRPANGDPKGMERFELEIGKIVSAAIRDAGPLK